MSRLRSRTGAVGRMATPPPMWLINVSRRFSKIFMSIRGIMPKSEAMRRPLVVIRRLEAVSKTSRAAASRVRVRRRFHERPVDVRAAERAARDGGPGLSRGAGRRSGKGAQGPECTRQYRRARAEKAKHRPIPDHGRAAVFEMASCYNPRPNTAVTGGISDGRQAPRDQSGCRPVHFPLI